LTGSPWFSSVRPLYLWASILIMPVSLISKSFPVYQASVILPLQTLYRGCAHRHKKTHRKSWGVWVTFQRCQVRVPDGDQLSSAVFLLCPYRKPLRSNPRQLTF
jgi:hypothetical protein